MLFEKIHLEDDEKIITIVHKHWFFMFSKSVGVTGVAIAPLVALSAVSTLSSGYQSSVGITLSDYTAHFVFMYSLWLLLNWMTIAHMWVTHHLDIWVITSRRIIAIDQVSLFRRKIGSFRLERLQDVNTEIHGIIATFLNFGTIEAQTASGSHDDEFLARHMPNPQEIKSIILKAADARIKQ